MVSQQEGGEQVFQGRLLDTSYRIWSRRRRKTIPENNNVVGLGQQKVSRGKSRPE
jgi:hypothetical protein